MPQLKRSNMEPLATAMDGYVERGEIAGIVTLVSRGPDIHTHATGTLTPGGAGLMRPDSIFRIASMTKPVAAAAAMLLVDDGVLRLQDSVEAWLPELAERRVLKHIGAALDDTVAAHRAITVVDLLTSTFGFGSVMANPDTYPIQPPIRTGNLGGDGFPHYSQWPAPDEWMRRLGALPLMYQPGERWLYNTSYDVLGVLIARASGRSLGDFLEQRLFAPLGMHDTAFSVPAARQPRLPGLYQRNAQSGALEIFDAPGGGSEYSLPVAFESGSGGLMSTAADYHAFCRMLLNQGMHAGTRVLSAASVAAMTRNQISAQQRIGADMFLGEHSGWGYGMAVGIRQTEPWHVVGSFGWDGGFGTSGHADPKNDLVGILLTQLLVDSPAATAVSNDFWRLAYAAVG